MMNFLKAICVGLLLMGGAQAQQLQPGYIYGNATGSLAPPKGNPAASYFTGSINLTLGTLKVGTCTLGSALVCAGGNILSTTGVGSPVFFGGTSASQAMVIESTTSGSPSGDSIGLFGSNITIGNAAGASGGGTVTLSGPGGGGMTINIAGSGNGLQALNVFNGVGGKQVWVPGAGTGTTPGTITFPAATDTLVVQNLAQTLSNKTLATPVITGTVSGSALATASQYFTGTASVLVPANVIYTAQTIVTFGATTTFDFSTFINANVTLTGNITTMSVANVKAGQAGSIIFQQDATGGRTTVWNSVFKFAGGVTPTLSTAASATDVLFYSCNSATFCAASLVQNVK